jgi:predicted RND superfamily exporter protein
MSHIVKLIDNYISNNPLPDAINHKWFGLTYINVIWQEKMVAGMLQAFLGSFLVVFIMMTVLFKSAAWGFLSMIPLSITIAAIYGFIGFVGKDYDMPVAVLSSLTLGLAVDFAIHFLARSRSIYNKTGSWETAVKEVFGEPARAISRNIIIIAVGFLPLLAAPLVPYQTVGIFLASILGVAGITTLILLPALLRIFEKILFPKTSVCCFICNGTASFITIISFLALMVLNIHQFTGMTVKTLTLYAIGAFPILAAVSYSLLKSNKCSHSVKDSDSQE